VVGYKTGRFTLWLVTILEGLHCGWLQDWMVYNVFGYKTGRFTPWLVTRLEGFHCGRLGNDVR
jgi:hypothetical protein